MRHAVGATLLGLVLVTACTSDPSGEPPVAEDPTPTATPSASPTTAVSSPAASGSSASPASPSAPGASTTPPAPRPRPLRFDAAAAMAHVRTLAGAIGPRLATGPAFRRAGRFVERRFRDQGYDVTRQAFPVPGGDSWGVPVRAGRSFNVIATPPGFDASRPHRILGAHLDTVAVAPGAEDNASGVAVLLELARLAAADAPRLPTVFVAFGAEEPRGSGDDMHHFGSQHYVREMSASARDALQTMVSLDRVGVGGVVPVCTGPLSPSATQNRILRAARVVGVPARRCENTASDHWSFEKAGYPVARLGSMPYAAYHSTADRPRVVNEQQLRRTGRLAWAWLH